MISFADQIIHSTVVLDSRGVSAEESFVNEGLAVLLNGKNVSKNWDVQKHVPLKGESARS